MAEFNRRPETNNIFEGTSDEVIVITLRVKDDFAQQYNNNSSNEIQFENLLNQIAENNIVCLFQKQKEFLNKDKITGAVKKVLPIKL